LTVIEDKWREGRLRPLQGNAPPDRPVSRGVLSFRSVCDSAFSATSPFQTTTPGPSVCVFEAWRNLSGPMWLQNQNQTPGRDRAASRWSAPSPGSRTRRENHAPSHRPQMSSGRLFLDRVGRHQSPSPLHRHTKINTHLQSPEDKHDISTLPGGRHFYFALTPKTSCLTRTPRRDEIQIDVAQEVKPLAMRRMEADRRCACTACKAV
jgi:hypothetical protein